MKAIARFLLACVCIAALFASAFSRSNNLLMGRVEAIVSTHTVIVTDCYRTSVPPQKLADSDSQTTYQFTPCRDADIIIRNEELVVNGRYYGQLQPTDAVLTGAGCTCSPLQTWTTASFPLTQGNSGRASSND